MGKVEKVVVLSVLFLMVVIFVVSIPDGSGNDVETRRVFAGERDATPDSSVANLSDRKGQVLPGDRWAEAANGASNGTKAQRDEALGGPRQRNSARQLGQPQRQGTDRTFRTEGGGPAATSTSNPARSATTRQPVSTAGLLSADVGANREAAAQPAIQDGPAQDPQPSSIPSGNGSARVPADAPTLQTDWDLITTHGLASTPHPEFMAYTSATGDTFETIAKRYYGNARHAGYLRRNNEGVRRLQPGQVVVIPCKHVAPTALTYFVQPGDSLWTIARDHYGEGTRWKEVFEANRKVLRSPDDLKAGQELLIP